MKAKLLFLFLFTTALAACKKDKYQTKPSLELKEVKVGGIQDAAGTVGSTIEFEITVTDKEGDVEDSIFIDKVDATGKCAGNNLLRDIYKIPDYPNNANQKVTFKVRYATINVLGYGLLGGASCPPRKDTSFFRIVVSDKAGNKSDTLKTGAVALPF